MTTYFSLEFESKSNDLDMDSYQVSSRENNKATFLAKKRAQNKEYTHNQKEFEEPENGNIFENKKKKNGYIHNFLMLQEFSFSSEGEKNLGIDEFSFLEKLREDENLIMVYYPGYYLNSL